MMSSICNRVCDADVFLFFFLVRRLSVKHEYEGEWNEGNTRLTSCDPHARRLVTSSNNPQEVENKQEIIFSYDVQFEVTYGH